MLDVAESCVGECGAAPRATLVPPCANRDSPEFCYVAIVTHPYPSPRTVLSRRFETTEDAIDRTVGE